MTFASCEDPNEGSLFMTPTTEEAEMSATDILERDAAQYSLWIQLLKHANYYNALKDGSARATVFCPTNLAMTRFLQQQGVDSVAQLPVDYAKSVARVHIINKAQYNDTQIDNYAEQGRSADERGFEIPDTTLLGTNLTVRYGRIETNVDDVNRHDDVILSADSIFFNNQAKLGKFTATTCANATLYEMDDVIVPLVETIMDRLDADPDTYGIFAQAVHDCGYDSIASLVSTVSYTLTGTVVTNYAFTCLAVPNSVYQAAGINDVAGLRSYLATHCDNEADTTWATISSITSCPASTPRTSCWPTKATILRLRAKSASTTPSSPARPSPSAAPQGRTSSTMTFPSSGRTSRPATASSTA